MREGGSRRLVWVLVCQVLCVPTPKLDPSPFWKSCCLGFQKKTLSYWEMVLENKTMLKWSGVCNTFDPGGQEEETYSSTNAHAPRMTARFFPVVCPSFQPQLSQLPHDVWGSKFKYIFVVGLILERAGACSSRITSCVKNIHNTSNFSQKVHLNIMFRFKHVKYHHHLEGWWSWMWCAYVSIRT